MSWIMVEPTPRWSVLIRRFSEDVAISEARSLALADDLLRSQPLDRAAFVALAAAPASAASTLLRIAQWQREFPCVASAVLLDAPNRELELGFREAGAQLVIASLFELPLVINMAKRHLAGVEPTRPDWQVAITARLPWAATRIP